MIKLDKNKVIPKSISISDTILLYQIKTDTPPTYPRLLGSFN